MPMKDVCLLRKRVPARIIHRPIVSAPRELPSPVKVNTDSGGK
jgi:hypothetical protein